MQEHMPCTFTYPAPCMTMHFPAGILFTSSAAAKIASRLTVSKTFFCVTADPPSFMMTSTPHLSAIGISKITDYDRHLRCSLQSIAFRKLVPAH